MIQIKTGEDYVKIMMEKYPYLNEYTIRKYIDFTLKSFCEKVIDQSIELQTPIFNVALPPNYVKYVKCYSFKKKSIAPEVKLRDRRKYRVEYIRYRIAKKLKEKVESTTEITETTETT